MSIRARSLAATLFNARRERLTISSNDVGWCGLPKDHKEAYRAQDELIRMMKEGVGETIGYKIGCTSTAAQIKAGVRFSVFLFFAQNHFSTLYHLAICCSEPVRGVLLSNLSFSSPHHGLEASSMGPLKIVEPEFAFELGRDLEPRTDYCPESLTDAIKLVRPCIEVATTAFADIQVFLAPRNVLFITPTASTLTPTLNHYATQVAGPNALIADNCAHGNPIASCCMCSMTLA